MSDPSDQDWTEREALAAEYALGVLEGPERRAAEDLLARDAGFAAAVARWRADIEPLVETADAVVPPAELWRRIDAELSPKPARVAPAASHSPSLWTSLVFWRGLSLASAGAAAVFAALLVSPQSV